MRGCATTSWYATLIQASGYVTVHAHVFEEEWRGRKKRPGVHAAKAGTTTDVYVRFDSFQEP
jgi:predicted amidohydrolase